MDELNTNNIPAESEEMQPCGETTPPEEPSAPDACELLRSAFPDIDIDAVRSLFPAESGKIPTALECGILGECLRDGSYFNRITARYGHVRICSPAAARWFQSYIGVRRPKREYIMTDELSSASLRTHDRRMPSPGDLVLYVGDLPRNEKLEKLTGVRTFFGLNSIMNSCTGVTLDLDSFPPEAGVSDFVSLLGVRYLVADESTARKIVSLAHDTSPLRACGITTVGVINSSGRLLLIRSSCAEADLETDTLMNISSSRMRDIIITDDDWFFRGLTDTADALLDAVSRRCNSVVVTGTPCADHAQMFAYRLGVTAAERLLSVSVCGSVQDGRKKKAPLFEKSGNLLYAVRMDARSPERYVNLLAGLLPAIYRDIGSGTIASVCRVSESLGDTASSAARRCGDTMRFVPYASAPSRLPENTLILETRLPVSAEPLGYLL